MLMLASERAGGKDASGLYPARCWTGQKAERKRPAA